MCLIFCTFFKFMPREALNPVFALALHESGSLNLDHENQQFLFLWQYIHSIKEAGKSFLILNWNVTEGCIMCVRAIW